MANKLKLYVKVWCPWCKMAEEWLQTHGYAYEQIDVEKNPGDFDEMIRLSSQKKTPTLVTEGGAVLPDFGPEELEGFLKTNRIQP